MTRKLAFAGLLLTGSWMGFASTSASASVSIGINVNIGPPPLPVYAQPPIPGPGYLWTPGYWAWNAAEGSYYWVPGAWTQPPQPGLLWTPAWWGWEGGSYLFHAGYWGPHVGFYGGINYGFGYTGAGFQGAYWRGGNVFYNRSVTNIKNVNITNVYNRQIAVNDTTVRNRVSYNGGPGGIQARPTPAQQAYNRQNHVPPTERQQQHAATARADPQSSFKANHGQPPKPASERPLGERGPAAGRPGARPGQPGGPHPGQPGGPRPGEPGGPRADDRPGAVARPGPDRMNPRPGERGPAPARPGERPGGPPREDMRPMGPDGRPHPGGPGMGDMERPHPMAQRPGGPHPGGGPRPGPHPGPRPHPGPHPHPAPHPDGEHPEGGRR